MNKKLRGNVNVAIPRTAHRRLKKLALNRWTSVQALVAEAVFAYLKKERQ
jgi:hypothetical protein